MNEKIKLTQIEQSPNPYAFKFVFNQNLVNEGIFELTPQTGGGGIKILEELLTYPIERIYLADNFFTINLEKVSEYEALVYELRDLIIQEAHSGALNVPFHLPENFQVKQNSEMVAIDELFLQSILPATMQHGGGVIFDGLNDSTAIFNLHGACRDCPYVEETIEKGVLPRLKNLIPSLTGYQLH